MWNPSVLAGADSPRRRRRARATMSLGSELCGRTGSGTFRRVGFETPGVDSCAGRSIRGESSGWSFVHPVNFGVIVSGVATGASTTVTLAEAVLPVPPLVELTAPD